MGKYKFLEMAIVCMFWNFWNWFYYNFIGLNWCFYCGSCRNLGVLMKKDNSQTRWEKKERKELLRREQDASCNTWYDRMNFYIRDFNLPAELGKLFANTKENFTGKKKGFTLIELGVCVAIIAVLVVISLPIYLDILAKSKEAAAAILKLTNGQ